jgi:transposase
VLRHRRLLAAHHRLAVRGPHAHRPRPGRAAEIDRLSQAVSEHLQLDAQTAAGIELAASITGVAQRTAEVMIAEIGTDMSVFPTARHLASWAGQRPGNNQSAGKRRSGRTSKGPKWLAIALHEAALAATRSKGTYLWALYKRLRPRIEHARALGAVKHSMITAYWHMFATGQLYSDLGGDYFDRRDPQRLTRRLVARLQTLGNTVTITPNPA